MVKLSVIIILIVTVSSAFAIDDDELPFGSFDHDYPFTADNLDTLHNILGFNIFVDEEIDSCDTVNMLYNAGILPVILHKDSIVKYSAYNYAKIHPESTLTEMRLYHEGGELVGGSWVSDSGSVDTLYGPDRGGIGDSNVPYLKMERKYPYYARPDSETIVITYQLSFYLKIDNDSDPNDIVATLAMAYHTWDRKPWSLGNLDPVIASECSTEFTTITRSFQIPRYIYEYSTNSVTDIDTVEAEAVGAAFVMITTGKREVSVDWIKIYDEIGRELVELGDYNALLVDNAIRFSDCRENVWGWYTRDEPHPLNMRPAGYILKVIRDSLDNQGLEICTAHNARNTVGYWFNAINTSIIASDYYPYTSNVNYSGWVSGNYNYLQTSLHNMASNYYEGYYQAADTIGNEFWVYPQAFSGGDGYGSWRRPTRAEFLCQTYMALACGVKGIIYWKYDYSEFAADTLYGLREVDGDKTALWNAVKDDINPYVKAIDATYLSLIRERAYSYNDTATDISLPDGRFVESISALSHPDSTNPDLGWFHVGEFHDASSNKYLMLVNRACNIDSANPAPSVTATIKFDPTNLGLGNYVFITDIAESVFRDTTGEWVGVPNTTYSATLDGTIPFTTVLGPGEGRLFKIARTDPQ
ncbi:MAG: hypothetical protein V3W18_01355 [candidate division Zixibacteria bacterium]